MPARRATRLRPRLRSAAPPPHPWRGERATYGSTQSGSQPCRLPARQATRRSPRFLFAGPPDPWRGERATYIGSRSITRSNHSVVDDMGPTGGTRSVNLSAAMDNTTNDGFDRAPVQTGVIIKSGLDVHAAQITSCTQVDGRLPKPPRRCVEAELLEWVAKVRGEGVTVYTCYEAGPGGYGLHRKLLALGAVNYVVAPRCWDAVRRVKTDKRDARELCVRLDQ